MIKNVIFDIGNVLMDFDWMGYMRSRYGDDSDRIEIINHAIYAVKVLGPGSRIGLWFCGCTCPKYGFPADHVRRSVFLLPTCHASEWFWCGGWADGFRF